MNQIFPIVPPSGGLGTAVLVVGAICAIGSTAALPASTAPAALLVVVSSVIVFGTLGYLLYSARNVRFEVGGDGLKIVGALYGRTIPSQNLIVGEARAVDLTTRDLTQDLNGDRDYRLSLRTNGIGLPGYHAGWFRLKNGQKALVFVTDQTHVVYVPTRENYSVMLSVADPTQFIGALKGTQN